jgi:hypothetical protein
MMRLGPIHPAPELHLHKCPLVLAFVACRLQGESVGLVFAARNPSHDRTLATCVPADQASDDRCGGR